MLRHRISIAYFLLLFLPLQFCWAAAASYCQHGSGAAARHSWHSWHPGHHEHQHNGADAKPTHETQHQQKAPLGADLDCSFCHLGCAQTLPCIATTLGTGMSAQMSWLSPAPWPASLIAKAIERPNWSRAA